MSTGIQPDGLWIYGDMAFKTATMCSPGMYRELIWPDHKRLADWAHRHGMKFIFHTDGDVNGVIDLYIQAGFDCLQPLEAKASMDIRKLCPRYGAKLAFFGNVDVMKMATNDLELIEEEIRSKLAAGKATKGYAYHSDHSVPPQVSWKTYQAIIEMVKKYGSY
jgi:uroporphyrinogen decarboxylase